MQFTCDRCDGEYEAASGNATAHLYLKDSRCNHIETRCTHCGNREVIFLGPKQITTVVNEDGVAPTVAAEATAKLRVRAEKAWAAAEELSDRIDPVGPAIPPVRPVSTSSDILQQYELTQRHEDLLDSFGTTLSNIPDGLLWDELRAEHDRKHPDRWVD